MGYTPWKERTAYVKNIGVVFGQRSQLWWDVPVIDSFELLGTFYKIPEGNVRWQPHPAHRHVKSG